MRSLRSCRAGWLGAVALLSSACAATPGSTGSVPAQISVFGRSHNRSDVDVYLLCGNRDARWLGVISRKGATGFEIPGAASHCVSGLNFFLVVRDRGRGYWVGPVRPRAGGQIELVVEKYAGLSAARVLGESAPNW
jgi:hypothetical protein